VSQSFADKLGFLFRTHRRPDGHEFSTRQVAAWIQERRDHAVSPAYVWQLRTGERTNPTMRHLEDLAAFFGVSPQYFFDDDETERTQAELALLAALKQHPEVQHLALRSLGVSPESLRAISETIERVRMLEGVDRRSSRSDEADGGSPGQDEARG
jgi:transcriptional regulator with XRE-family HTH domain